ncbi:MAG: glucosamine-6-phosphate deaminase [Spirochaetaceae bacterium]|jgi:glucosamine-6-phosphate deaminase|nr:glucosamine-6-phosphate deaminase [Spirochaetaceae bacterium]
MRLIIEKNYEAVSLWTARYIAAKIAAFRPAPERPFVLGLPTGGSPLGVYRELIRLHQSEGLSFASVLTFNMDEYSGLGAEDPRSYHRFMADNFFSHIDIKPENTHILDGLAADSDAECAAFEQKILDSGGVELFLGGVGEDGHIAFNEPFSSLHSRTRVKTLTWSTRNANARFFGGDSASVPATALTVGIGTIMDARELLIIASGKNKAQALRNGIEGAVSHACPLSVLQLHRRSIMVCDEDAACALKDETVQYFKELEGLSCKSAEGIHEKPVS